MKVVLMEVWDPDRALDLIEHHRKRHAIESSRNNEPHSIDLDRHCAR